MLTGHGGLTRLAIGLAAGLAAAAPAVLVAHAAKRPADHGVADPPELPRRTGREHHVPLE